MREFKTRREAAAMLKTLESDAVRCADAASGPNLSTEGREFMRGRNAHYRKQAARIRALLTTLPEDDNAAR